MTIRNIVTCLISSSFLIIGSIAISDFLKIQPLNGSLLECTYKVYQTFDKFDTIVYYAKKDDEFVDVLTKRLTTRPLLVYKDVHDKVLFGRNLMPDVSFNIITGTDFFHVDNLYRAFSYKSTYLLVSNATIDFFVNNILRKKLLFMWINLYFLDDLGIMYNLIPTETTSGLGAEFNPITNCKNINSSNLFVQKTPKNFKGFIFQCSYSYVYPYVDHPRKDAPGLDISTLREAEKLYNFTINYKEIQGAINSYKEIFTHETDILIGGYIISQVIYRAFNAWYPQLQFEEVLIVPLAAKVSSWLGLTYAFDLIIWIVLITVIVICILICKVIFSSQTYNNRKISTMEIYMIVLSQSVRQPEYFLARIIFASWVLFMLIVSNAYTGTFVSFLVNPVYEKQINSVDDVVEANLSIISNMFGGFENDPIVYEDHKYYNIVRNRYRHCSSYEYGCLYEAMKYRNSAVIAAKELVEHFDFFFENGKQTMHTIHIKTDFLYYIVGKENALLDLVQSVINRLVESGIRQKWMQDLSRKRGYFDVEPFMTLRMDHLWLIFYIFAFGLFASTVVFFCELFYGEN